MWESVARFILKFRWVLMTILIAVTIVLGFYAAKVELSYEYTRAVPTDNPKYIAYQEFLKQFGQDGTMMVVGVQTEDFFNEKVFNEYLKLASEMKQIKGVEDVLQVGMAINLVKDSASDQIVPQPIFSKAVMTQAAIDSAAKTFKTLPFYQGLLYNPNTNAYLMGVTVNKNVLNSKSRDTIIPAILQTADKFGKTTGLEVYYSGMPHIRTSMALKIQSEMKWFLIGSIILSAILLMLSFRSISAMLMSLAVVIIGVVWSLGTLVLMGYKISLLTALIPPLVVVIGIPNCIYFLNKYHTAFNATPTDMPDQARKELALHNMISKMGVVTLFCNIAAAIGFAVFALTKSEILNEFGLVAGINIMGLFFISIIFIPAILSLLAAPKPKHTRYLQNKAINAFLNSLERWALNKQALIYTVTGIVVVASVIGMFRLKAEGFIVDDLPKTDKIYTDLKFFESNFKGVMPLEIVVDTKRKNGLRINPLQTFERIDSLSAFIAAKPEFARPLSIVEGLKFVRQAYYEGDENFYAIPNSFDVAFLARYLNMKGDGAGDNSFNKIVATFMDSTRQRARISVNTADVGSVRLPILIDEIKTKGDQLFDTAKYDITYTGSTVTFLEGSTFIINGLKESIFWAFLLITLCMLYLFKSFRILICSLLPNVVPLLITAGVMGWVGVALKPSTVIVFSVALGIAIDITIRFLVNYKQELSNKNASAVETVVATIHNTGISIIYTSLVLIAGFVIFCFSDFGGIKSLGWLTSLTLVLATLTNLIFLPTLLLMLVRKKRK